MVTVVEPCLSVPTQAHWHIQESWFLFPKTTIF